jgi:hypothetical protein
MVIFKYFFEQQNQLHPSTHAYHEGTEVHILTLYGYFEKIRGGLNFLKSTQSCAIFEMFSQFSNISTNLQ